MRHAWLRPLGLVLALLAGTTPALAQPAREVATNGPDRRRAAGTP